MEKRMYYVFGTYPKIYIGGVREGGLDLIMKFDDNTPDVVFEGECDCINGFKHYLREIGLFYNDIMLKTMVKVWEIEKDDYQVPKCLDCYNSEEDNWDHCLSGWNYYFINKSSGLFDKEYVFKGTPLSDEELFSNIPFDNFKNFNLESFRDCVHFICYIDKVYSPKLVDGHLEQTIKITDNNTKKTIKCDISKFADFDKWEKNQKIELIGEYHCTEGFLFVTHLRELNSSFKSKKDTDSIRQSSEYNRWRDKVKEVGECFICGRKNHLVAHHINSVSEYPELALDEKNGVCLCKAHHDIYHEDFSNTGDALSFAKFVSIHKNVSGGK